MVDLPKKNYNPLPTGKFGRLDNPATLKRHRTNSGKSGVESERIRAHNSLHSLKYKKRRKAAESNEIRFMTKKEREKWIENYVERETATARKRAEEADSAWEREKERLAAEETVMDQPTAVGSKKTFEEMLKDIGDSIEDLATSDEEDE